MNIPEVDSRTAALSARAKRWLIFLIIFGAVIAYVSWNDGSYSRLARRFLRQLLRALM